MKDLEELADSILKNVKNFDYEADLLVEKVRVLSERNKFLEEENSRKDLLIKNILKSKK